MPCLNETWPSVAAVPSQKPDRFDQPALVRLIVATVDAFQEALDMQRVVRKRFPFDE